MTLTAFVQSVGNLGIFPSRAFIPAFLTALLLRLAPHWAAIHNSPVLQNLSDVPTWFTCDAALVILGMLSLLEVIATKSPEVREFLLEFDHWIKAGMAFLTTAGVLSATDRQVANTIRDSAMPTAPQLAVAGVVGASVFYIAWMRSTVMGGLNHIDPHDDLHVQRLLSWMEDAWGGFGVVLVVLFPFLMLLLVALALGALFGLRRLLEYREEHAKVPCAHCGQPIYLMALNCPACKHEVAQPRAVGFMGTPSAMPAPDRSTHALDLIGKKRCPVCATRFKPRTAQQTCEACGHRLMADTKERAAYLNHIAARVPKTLAICMAFSVIPVVGLIPGIIYYRIKLVSPFRQYIGLGTGILVKWAVRLLNLFLIVMQTIPILGAFMVPLMAYLSYVVYRGVYVRSLGAELPQAAYAPMPVPAQVRASGPVVPSGVENLP